jgi:NAD(P)-dependent dehydrogenase (short-subunit alcohol dehydrogenase family)
MRLQGQGGHRHRRRLGVWCRHLHEVRRRGRARAGGDLNEARPHPDVATAWGRTRGRTRVDVACGRRAGHDGRAEQHFGRIDILVNNAGITHLPQPLEDVSEDDFDRIVAVNMKAIYLAMREVVPRMKAQAAGRRASVAWCSTWPARPA